MTAPILVFGWGNPARGDDALGPLFIERLAALRLTGVECRCEYQLQVEHALELAGRRFVLFVDASPTAPAPFQHRRLQPRRDASFTTHALTPETLLSLYHELFATPPECGLIAIRGEDFDLGVPLSEAAAHHLEEALRFVRTALYNDWLNGNSIQP